MEELGAPVGRWARTLAVARALAPLVIVPLLACTAAEESEPVQADAEPVQADARTFGYLDTIVPRTLRSTADRVSGWALDEDGVARVELVDGAGRRWPLRFGIARADVEAVHGGYPDSAHAGFEGVVSSSLLEGRSSHVEVVVTDGAGRETRLGGPLAIGPHRDKWRRLLAERAALSDRRFHVLFATSAISRGGAAGIDTAFAAHTSETMRVGMRVPALYMRTTGGRDEDWVFAPDFDTSRMHGPYPVAEDSLTETARWAIEHDVPVLFTLNGGVWGDSRGTAPEWDLTDHLEESPENCQWNDLDEVVADDHPGLPSAIAGVELARSLTLNVFADEVRRYKKRNLQAAGAWVARFAKEHPDLFLGVNLDPDVYMNPFFEGQQWYDYNPDTLRQFRHWLRGDGPYAGEGEHDLSAYRRARPLSLAELNRLAATDFATWEEVDAPRLRDIPVYAVWDVPHFQVWERFRRHVVDLHYDDLSTWLHASGIASERIFSSQGFSPRNELIDPFPVALDDDIANYDAGGMTLEGALPRDGHIGAIVYGDSATNTVEMTNGLSLFRTLHAYDPGWAIVEFHPADLRSPTEVPGYQAGYRALRDAFNFGARFVSPMAWNGIDGDHRDHPGFVSFMALRRTPLEDAIRFFMDERADLPRGALLFTFGDFVHADDDGWRVERGAEAIATRGVWQLEIDEPGGEVVLVSPPDQLIQPELHDLLVLGLGVEGGEIESVAVEARSAPDAPWVSIVDPLPLEERRTEAEGLYLPLRWRDVSDPRELRLTIALSSGAGRLGLDHVLLYPAAPAE